MCSFRETGQGLACDSESSFEAAHIDFSNVWSRYIGPDISSPKYRELLLRAVCTFNGSHTPIHHHLDDGRGANTLEQTDQRHIQDGPGAVT